GPPSATLVPYTTLFRSKVLNKYSCESGNSIVYTSDDHKYEACYDEHNIHNKIIDDTYRLAYFKSTGTAEDVTKTLISGVKLGARDRKSTRLNSSHVKIS